MRVWQASCVLILSMAGFEIGCATPEAVSKFCSSSVTALQQGPAIFQDMKDSCVRTAEALQPIDDFRVDENTAQSCDAAVPEKQIAAACRVLAGYFSALGQLAAVGTTSAAGDAKKDADQVVGGTVAKDPNSLNTARGAANALANLMASAAINGIKQKKLTTVLTNADPNVQAMTEALAYIVQNDYVGELLLDERNKQAQRFTLLARSTRNGPVTVADLLAVNQQWNQTAAAIETKRSGAVAFVTALRRIRSGHAALLKQAQIHRLSANDLEGALTPYSQSLSDLAVKMDKRF